MDATVIDAADMDTTKIVAFARTVPIFHALSKDQLRQIAEAADVRSCHRGEVPAEPTSQENELFIVVTGEFRVYLRQDDADFSQELARLGPGDCYGVIPVVTGQRAAVSIESLEPGRVIALSERAIGKLFEGSPSPGFARAMWRSLGSHVAQSIDRIGVVFFAELDSFPNLPSTCRLLEADWSGVLSRGKNGEGFPPGGQSGRVGAYEVMFVTDQLRDLIYGGAPRSEFEKALDHLHFFSFPRYYRFLLKAGLVAPERVERILPKEHMAFSA